MSESSFIAMDANTSDEKQCDNQLNETDVNHNQSHTQRAHEQAIAQIEDNITTNDGNRCDWINNMIKLKDLVEKDIIDHTFASKFLIDQNSGVFNDMIADALTNKRETTTIKDPISHLNEWCAMNFTRYEFVETDQSGPSHCPRFTITCKLMYNKRQYVTTGSEKSKKDAKKKAAIAMIEDLKVGPNHDESHSNNNNNEGIDLKQVVNNAMVDNITEQSLRVDCLSNSCDHKTDSKSVTIIDLKVPVVADTNHQQNVANKVDVTDCMVFGEEIINVPLSDESTQSSTNMDNPISYLSIWCQTHSTPMATFGITERIGPSHCQTITFTCKLVYRKQEYVTTGCGRTAKDAKRLSAIAMIDKLKIGPQLNIQSHPVVNKSNTDCISNCLALNSDDSKSKSESVEDLKAVSDGNEQQNVDESENKVIDRCYDNNELITNLTNLITDDINSKIVNNTEQSLSIDFLSNSCDPKTDFNSETMIDLKVVADTNHQQNVANNVNGVENKVIDVCYDNNKVITKSTFLITDDIKSKFMNQSITIPNSNTISDNDSDELSDVPNPISYLQEWCQKRNILLPVYDTNQPTGPDHCQSFTANCKLLYNGQQYKTCGCGRSKKIAMKSAAIKMIKHLKIEPKIMQESDNLQINLLVTNDKSNDGQSLSDNYSDIPNGLRKSNPKGYVNELCAKRGYTSIYEPNVDHSGCAFNYSCIIYAKGDKIVGHGSGGNKKDAQQCAAEHAIDQYFNLKKRRNDCNAVPVVQTDEKNGTGFYKKFAANCFMDSFLRDIEPNQYNMQTMEKILAKIDCKYEMDDSDEKMVILKVIWRQNNIPILSSFGVIDETIQMAKDIAAKKAILMLNVLKFSTIHSNSFE